MSRQTILAIVAALILALGGYAAWHFTASGSSDTGAAAPDPGKSGSSGKIPLTKAQVDALGIRFASAIGASDMTIATLPATITPPPNARVAVAAPLPGIVTRVFVVEGQSVNAGQPLATIASRDLVSLKAELARARSRRSVEHANAARLNQLAREGVIAAARADEARAKARQADVDVAEQSRLIAMTHGGGNGAVYTLSSPISGRVSDMTIAVGKSLDPGAAPFVIDGGGTYQVEAQLPQRLVGQVKPGMRVEIGDGVIGTVLAVGGSIDPATRSVSLVARVPAAPGIIAGRATQVKIIGPAPAGVLTVPAAAVVDMDGQSTMFVAQGNAVVPRRVKLAPGEGKNVIVTEGLSAGERVAVSAVSELQTLAAAE